MLMLGYNYATFVSDGSEKYFREEKYLNDNKVDTKTVRFPDSLLAFLYLDIDAHEPLLKKISDDLWQLTLTKEQSYLESAYAVLDELAVRHTYFEELRIEYRYRAARAVLLDHYTEDILQRQVLISLPGDLRMIQTQLLELIENVLDIDRGKMAVRKKLVGYYRDNGERAFRFAPQPMSFELIDEDTFAEVLRPNSIYDLIDFHARECIKREVRMRRCKNCGRYFAIQSRSTARATRYRYSIRSSSK